MSIGNVNSVVSTPQSSTAPVTSTSSITGTATTSSASATQTAVQAVENSRTTIAGLASGINTTNIINALIAADAVPEQQLQTQQTTAQTHASTLSTLNSDLLAAQADFVPLEQSGTFQQQLASSSANTIVNAVANGNAQSGNYELNVSQLAQANQIVTGGTAQTSATTANGEGSLVIQVGTNAAQTIALPDTSLNGIAQAINAANVGATASVMNDGTGYRLMLTANETGTDNAINEVTATDANPTSSTALSTLFSGSQAEATSGVGVGVGTGGGMLTIFAAQNAKLTMGGVESQLGTIVEQSNSVNNLIPGVNLSLYNTGAATISVANNPTGVVQAITTMVNDVNSALTYFTQNGSYDTTTNTAGALFNDDPIRDGLNSLITTLTGSVAGLPSSMNSLGALGITVDQQTGLLDINQTALTAAVTQDPQGVANIFTNTSTSTSSGVQFAALTGNLDTSQPFNVDVTTAATQAIVTGSQPITGNVTIGSGDNTLSLNVNGQIVSASIATGTYTAASLVTAMQSAITQAAPAGSNLGVQMSVNTSGAIQINTTGFGSSQSVDVLTAPSALGMPTGSATGTDVQGTINGIAAQGQGQVLTGLAGTPVAGLVLSVTAQVPENDVTVNISQGLAQQASNQLTNLTDSQTGSLVTEEQSLNSQVSDYATQITQFNAKLSTQETLYQEQFTEMETLIQSANSQGSFLTQFVAQMDNTSSSSSSGSG